MGVGDGVGGAQGVHVGWSSTPRAKGLIFGL